MSKVYRYLLCVRQGNAPNGSGTRITNTCKNATALCVVQAHGRPEIATPGTTPVLALRWDCSIISPFRRGVISSSAHSVSVFALISMTALVMGALVRREHLLRIDSDANEICHSGLIGYLKRVFVNGPHLKEWACGSVLVRCRFCVLVAYRLPAFRFTGVCRAPS